MRLARQRLRNWAQTNRITISAEQEIIILDRFSVEPDPYEWSEQDIYEQTRNFLKYGTFEKPIKCHPNPAPTVEPF